MTARNHFDEDIQRVEAFLVLAKEQSEAGSPERLVNDLRLSAIASSVGAMDAYLCDKYVDCITAALRAYANKSWDKLRAYANKSWDESKPEHPYLKISLPAREIIDASKSEDRARPQWEIRMAARKLMERDNMLSISKVKENFNPILPEGHKLWNDFIHILIAKNRKRFTGVVEEDLDKLSGEELQKKRKSAIDTVKDCLVEIVQIRHDWIHNCGRPKSAIKRYSQGKAKIYIYYIKTFVEELDNFIEDHRLV
ncbi:MAG: hypothetical protein ERJ67_11030 [Aphanocapsa feldmannii 277cV]|nr:MAG: hypothetical protein ERJ67_11030 [Aphanocapsa feldmannii 277cV]